MSPTSPHAQTGFDVRFEWGIGGLADIALDVAGIIVVDILSFTTAVEIACSARARVCPASSSDHHAAGTATQADAILAVNRDQISQENPYSLSPATLRDVPPGTNLVLPSPNGAEVSLAATRTGVPVYAACLRNRTAVAQAVEGIHPLAVIAAGERRTDGSLRPAWEDLVGSGAIIDALLGSRSPESDLAVAAWRCVRDVEAQMRRCVSGRELLDGGFSADVELASRVDVSDCVPRLHDGCYMTA